MSDQNLPAKTAIQSLGLQLQCDPVELKKTLKATAFKNCATDEQFMTCVMVAQIYKLNPFLRQIYAFPGKNGDVVPIVPIDGWIALVQSHKEYDGVEQKENMDLKTGDLLSVTTTLYRKDQGRPTIHTEYLKECFRETEPWKKWSTRMLCWKSYIQTARMAFGFSGIYDEDEADRIDEATDVQVGKPEVDMPRAIEEPKQEDPGEEPPQDDTENSELADKAQPPAGPTSTETPPAKITAAERKSRGFISEPQEKRLWAIAKSYQVSVQTVNELLEKRNIPESSVIGYREYDGIVDAVKAAGVPPIPTGA